jgi:hypothetical protein
MSNTTGVDALVGQIGAYLAGDTSSGDFVRRYQDDYKELGPLDEPTFVALDRLFFVCEDYYDDPELRDPGDPDEDALRAAAQRALAELGRRA